VGWGHPVPPLMLMLRGHRLLDLLGGVAMLASAAAPAWADIGRESGDELLARCEPATRLLAPAGGAELTPEQRDAGLGCIAFVEGFIWGHAWSAWRDRADMYYCPPQQFSSREAVPAIVAYLRREEGRRVQRAHLLVFAALSHAWPCTPPLSTAP
jgi:hypothetical protein